MCNQNSFACTGFYFSREQRYVIIKLANELKSFFNCNTYITGDYNRSFYYGICKTIAGFIHCYSLFRGLLSPIETNLSNYFQFLVAKTENHKRIVISDHRTNLCQRFIQCTLMLTNRTLVVLNSVLSEIVDKKSVIYKP